MSTTEPRLARSSRNSGRNAVTRSTNSCTVALVAARPRSAPSSGTGRGRTGHSRSPSTASASRLVASRRTRGHDRTTSSANVPAASTRCSQLSSTRSSSFARRKSSSASPNGRPVRGATASAVATARGMPSYSITDARSQNQAPSGSRDATSAATWSASRVLPTPPTPIRVTSGPSATSSETRANSVSRPTKVVTGTGTLPGTRVPDRSGGRSLGRSR